MKTIPRNVNLAAFLVTTAVVQPVQGVGDAFRQPFKASVRVRQLCYEESIYGCSPDDIPGMNGEGGRRRHLLETDPDGQMFLTYEEEVIETGPASSSPGGGVGPSNIQAAPLDAADFWIFEDIVTEDGVNYNRYVARFDNITRDFSDDASEQHKMLIESGMVPDVYEYLETTEGGTPYAIRLFSSRNDNLMYSETKFAFVEELTEDELVLSVARADSGGLRRKLQQKTKSAKIATRPRRYSAAKGNLRRRATAVVSGLIVPPNCLTNPDSFFCFALLSSQDAETGDKTIALNIALQSLLTDDSANIFGRLVLGPDGQLLYLEGSAEGCASPVGFRVGSLAAVGVEICVDGNVEFVPGLSLDASFGISAGIFFDVFGFINAKLDLLGGQVGVSAAATPNDGVLRFESFNGNVYSRLQFLVVYVEAGVSIESSPRDVLEVNNWVTNIFFTPAVGIDLWLWKASARTSFKIAQVGPERVQQSVNPPIELPPDLNTPLCPSSNVEASRNGDLLVIVNLPGGRKEGSVLTIDAGVRALDKDGVCYRVAWESIEFTCKDNSNGQHEWIQTNGQFTTPNTNDASCSNVGLDNEYVQTIDSSPTICSAKSFERRNGPIWVSFQLPGDQVSGSAIDFEAGFAYRSVDQTCYSLSWGEHAYQCGEDGEWIETTGSWPLIRHQCSNGEGFISNGDQTYLEVSNTMATSCSATTFEWSNHPIYVKISLPEGNGAIDFDYGSAARRLSDDSCPSLEWVAPTFTCDRTTVEWTMTKGYFRNRVPMYCYMWEPGYGYISGGEQEYMQVVDTTVLPGCPATESAYSCGPLWVTFSPPDSYLRGDTLSFDGGAMARGDCHGLSWSAHEFYCDPFRGVWLNKEGTLLTCNGHTEPEEGSCTDGELAITNGNQPYLKVADATPEVVPTPAPNTPSPTVTTYCHCPRCDQSVWDTDAGGYTCGARIIYLNRVRGMTLQAACRQVAGAEFPWECGQCDPNYCR